VASVLTFFAFDLSGLLAITNDDHNGIIIHAKQSVIVPLARISMAWAHLRTQAVDRSRYQTIPTGKAFTAAGEEKF
jgi:hypothetical protein